MAELNKEELAKLIASRIKNAEAVGERVKIAESANSELSTPETRKVLEAATNEAVKAAQELQDAAEQAWEEDSTDENFDLVNEARDHYQRELQRKSGQQAVKHSDFKKLKNLAGEAEGGGAARAVTQKVGQKATQLAAQAGKAIATRAAAFVAAIGWPEILAGLAIIATIIVAILVVSIVLRALGGFGGKQPAIAAEVTNQEDMTVFQLLRCQEEEPKKIGDPKDDEEVQLDEKCVQFIRDQIEKAKQQIPAIKERINEFAEENDKQPLLDELAQVEAKMDEVLTTNGKYKELKPKYEELISLADQFLIKYRKILGVDIEVPFMTQDPGSADCGRASVGMVVNHFRRKAGQPDLPYKESCEDFYLVANLNEELQKVGGPIYQDRRNIGLAHPDYISGIVESLNKGNPVVWMSDLSATNRGHFIVLRGYRTENGNVAVFVANDPGNGAGEAVTTVQGVKLTPENLRLHGDHPTSGTGYFYSP